MIRIGESMMTALWIVPAVILAIAILIFFVGFMAAVDVNKFEQAYLRKKEIDRLNRGQ